MSHGFSDWNETDPEGWSPCHRAGAYGSGDNIRNIVSKGGNLRAYTTDHLWGPVTCAVWNSNVSTFEAFVDLLPVEEIVDGRDSRGCTLLHFAAQNGCRRILEILLDRGANPGVLSVGTDHWVNEKLDWKDLTAEMVAREYGHGDLWDDVVKRWREERFGHQSFPE